MNEKIITLIMKYPYVKISILKLKKDINMTSKTLPFHADTVGSYLRSQPLKEARAKFAAGELSREQLTEVEDQEIAKSVQDKAMEAAKAVGDAKGLSVVMTKDTVLYGGVDITDQVLKKLANDAKK